MWKFDRSFQFLVNDLDTFHRYFLFPFFDTSINKMDDIHSINAVNRELEALKREELFCPYVLLFASLAIIIQAKCQFGPEKKCNIGVK